MKRLLFLVLLVLTLVGCSAFADTSKPWYDDHGTLHNLKVCEDEQEIATDTPVLIGFTKIGSVNVPNYMHIYTYKTVNVCYYK